MLKYILCESNNLTNQDFEILYSPFKNTLVRVVYIFLFEVFSCFIMLNRSSD